MSTGSGRGADRPAPARAEPADAEPEPELEPAAAAAPTASVPTAAEPATAVPATAGLTASVPAAAEPATADPAIAPAETATARPALARLVETDVDNFARDHWARAPLLSRAVDPGGFADLFSADAVDELIAERALRTPFVRMAQDGAVLAPKLFTAPGGLGAEIADQVSADRVLAELEAGATLVLQGLHRTWPPLEEFTRHLVADLGHPCQVNAYITPAGSRGFDPHYDVHDVFVVQIHGEKHWTIHEPVLVDPLRTQGWDGYRAAVAGRAQGTPVIDATFRAGDVLYLPRGWIHSARAGDATSIHLTIGVAAITGSDVAEQAISRVIRSEALRRSLPLGFDPADADDVRSIVTTVLDGLVAEFAAEPLRAELERSVAEALQTRLRDSSRPEPVRPLATVDAIAALSAESTVRLRSGLRARIVHSGDGVRIIRSASTVTLPAEAGPAVDALAAGSPIMVGRLPGLDAESAIVVVRRLLREGILLAVPDGSVP